MSWEWFEQQPGKFRFDPTWSASGNYDTYLRSLNSSGILPVLCINQSPMWLIGDGKDPDNAPVAAGMDMSNPQSYKSAARMYFQFAARYGRTAHPKHALMIDTTERWTNEGKNAVVSGMALVKHIEVWNEPDKWWKRGTSAYFEPEEYAAMLSACYDGHGGALGPGHGIKTADKSMIVVMGGLSDFDTAYVERMALWFSVHRKDRAFAADIINYHHYCNMDNGLFKGREVAISPVDDGMEARLLAVRAHSYKYCRNRPIWWSEFGYDTEIRANSPQYANEDSAAAWIVSSLKIAKRSGIDGAFIYNSIDENSPQNWLFQSCGLSTGEAATPRYFPKKSFYLVRDYLVE